MVKEFISQLLPDKLTSFEKHPYQVREDTAMDELVKLVRVQGILLPLPARPKGEGCELVGGHRRRLAAQKLGLLTAPVLVREMADGRTALLMADSKLQWENMLPIERAFAYNKMKLEAMKWQDLGKPTMWHPPEIQKFNFPTFDFQISKTPKISVQARWFSASDQTE